MEFFGVEGNQLCGTGRPQPKRNIWRAAVAHSSAQRHSSAGATQQGKTNRQLVRLLLLLLILLGVLCWGSDDSLFRLLLLLLLLSDRHLGRFWFVALIRSDQTRSFCWVPVGGFQQKEATSGKSGGEGREGGGRKKECVEVGKKLLGERKWQDEPGFSLFCCSPPTAVPLFRVERKVGKNRKESLLLPGPHARKKGKRR